MATGEVFTSIWDCELLIRERLIDYVRTTVVHAGGIPNFGLQEYRPHTVETDAVFPYDYWFEDGLLHVGETPGLGVDIDIDIARAAEHGYRPASPPINRLRDGTMFHW